MPHISRQNSELYYDDGMLIIFKNTDILSYCVMAACRIHCEVKRIAVEMFARVGRVAGSLGRDGVLVVETGALVVL